MPLDYSKLYKPEPIGGARPPTPQGINYDVPGSAPGKQGGYWATQQPYGNPPAAPPVTLPPPNQPFMPIGQPEGQPSAAPPAVPAGAKEALVKWEHAAKYPGAGANVQQQWYRSPAWGGHVIWNPYWGYQDFPTIASMYSEAGGPVSQDVFQGWGLTPQLEGTWQDYYGDRMAGGGTAKKQAQQATGGTGAYDGNIYQNFPYPAEWDLASGVLSNFAMGLPTQIPEQWNWLSEYANQMAQTGMPTDVSQWWESQQPLLEQRISDQAKQAYEMAGLTGTEWSSPLARTLTDITGRETAGLWGQLATQQLGLDEAAKQRMLSAYPMLFGVGQGITGLAEAAKGRGMQAAGMLGNIGQMRSILPQQVAQGLYQTGMGQTGLSQEMINRQMQEFLRLVPENSPWLQMALSLAGGMQQPYAPQMYNPSIWTQLLNAGTSMLPWFMMMNQGGGNTDGGMWV